MNNTTKTRFNNLFNIDIIQVINFSGSKYKMSIDFFDYNCNKRIEKQLLVYSNETITDAFKRKLNLN